MSLSVFLFDVYRSKGLSGTKDILISSNFMCQNCMMRQAAEIENHLMRACLSFSVFFFSLTSRVPRGSFVYFHKENAFYSTRSDHGALFQSPRMCLWKIALFSHPLRVGARTASNDYPQGER